MALNLAALIYSDCNMPDIARALCWRQFDVFAAAGPYDDPTATTAVQPLINIGRLDTRAGHGAGAYDLHEAMLLAVRHGTPATIDGRTIDLATIARPGDSRRALTKALWMVLLADGLRALCRAGRWDQAHEQARTHRGIGEQLLDGRQIAIIAAANHGDHDEAKTLIDTAVVTEPWEHLAAACLHVLTDGFAGAGASADVDTMLSAYDALDLRPEHTAFLVRSGLTVLHLAHGHGSSNGLVADKLKKILDEDLDAYAAAELLKHAPSLPRPVVDTLIETVAAAGLGQHIPTDLEPTLTTAVDTAVHTLEQIVSTSSPA